MCALRIARMLFFWDINQCPLLAMRARIVWRKWFIHRMNVTVNQMLCGEIKEMEKRCIVLCNVQIVMSVRGFRVCVRARLLSSIEIHLSRESKWASAFIAFYVFAFHHSIGNLWNHANTTHKSEGNEPIAWSPTLLHSTTMLIAHTHTALIWKSS